VVTTTELGTRHILFQGQRYLIVKDGSLHLARAEVGHTYADFYKVSTFLANNSVANNSGSLFIHR
jgi:hypothetical protein